MKNIIKLTDRENTIVLIGINHIIRIKDLRDNSNVKDYTTEITSVGAMTTTTLVKETIEDIYKLINN